MYEFRVTKDWPYHISSGGVVYKEENGTRKYALLFRNAASEKGPGESWNLPKGTLHSDESLEQGALREIKEETGFDVEIEKYLGTDHSAYTMVENGWNVDRTIHYFVAHYVSGHESMMDAEHDSLEWFTAEEAIAKLAANPKREDEFIKRAEKYFELAQS